MQCTFSSGKMQHLLQQTKQSSQSNTTASNMTSSITVPVPIKEPSQSSPTVPRSKEPCISTNVWQYQGLPVLLIPAAAKTSAPVISTVQLMPLLSLCQCCGSLYHRFIAASSELFSSVISQCYCREDLHQFKHTRSYPYCFIFFKPGIHFKPIYCFHFFMFASSICYKK
ncbi:hypothetical protein HPP92_010117 [Vanilla planifolia]|uniref:Uncharacterized protein n=1 Tax=Vanilla planifolia TaxID=51239 RepID=A0A835V265_VANPL|nr:hypothetical protein HPP92_010117 [Vanilla planifolia]